MSKRQKSWKPEAAALPPELRAIIQGREAALRPFVGRSLVPGTAEHGQFLKAERACQEQLDAWRREHGSADREPASPSDLRAWIEQRRMIAEATAAAHDAGAAALDEDLAALGVEAHGRAVEMRGRDPALPPPPEPADRPALDSQRLCDWCTTAATARARKKPPRSRRAPPVETLIAGASGFLGAMDLARKFNVPKEKMDLLHKRLQRFREKHEDDTRYVVGMESPEPRGPRYLHAVEHVFPEIKDLAQPPAMSGQRQSKKSLHPPKGPWR